MIHHSTTSFKPDSTIGLMEQSEERVARVVVGVGDLVIYEHTLGGSRPLICTLRGLRPPCR